MKIIRIALWAAALLALGTLIYGQNKDRFEGPQTREAMVKKTGRGPVLDFALTSHLGTAFSSDDLKGRYRLMYFGYTYCPDKCPLDLARMTLILSQLEEDGISLDRLAALFVSIDPARDTVKAMAETLSLYHPHMIGLTGSEEEIADVAKRFNVYYRKIEEDGVEGYLMDHFVGLFLYDEEGRFITVFGPGEPAEKITLGLKKLLEGPL